MTKPIIVMKMPCELFYVIQVKGFLIKCSTSSSVPLKISDAPKDLQDKWTSILKDCTKQLTMTLVKFHQGQAAHQEQLAETLIHNASYIIIPEYITTVPDITSKIESSIEELMCETSLIDKKFCKRPHPTTKTKTTKKLYHPHPPRRHLVHHQ